MRTSLGRLSSLAFGVALWTALGSAAVTSRARAEDVPPAFDGHLRKVWETIMLGGSAQMSRTIGGFIPQSTGWGSASVEGGWRLDLRDPKARDPFNCAVRFLIANYRELPLDASTADKLNRILLPEISPEISHATTQNLADFNAALKAYEGPGLPRHDPIGFSEYVHEQIITRHFFAWGGNGRVARLMADLVLLKAGLPPAFHTDITRYFNQGSPWGAKQATTRVAYFRQAVERSKEFLRTGKAPAVWPPRHGPTSP